MQIFTMSGWYENATVIAESEEQAREIINSSYYTNKDIEDWRLNNTIDLDNADVEAQLVSHYSE